MPRNQKSPRKTALVPQAHVYEHARSPLERSLSLQDNSQKWKGLPKLSLWLGIVQRDVFKGSGAKERPCADSV